MLIEQEPDDHVLEPPEAAADAKAVAFADGTVGFGVLAIHLHLAALAGAFGFGAGLEEARDVQPDVEARAVGHG